MFKNHKLFMSLLCVLGLGFAQVTWAPGEVSFDNDAAKMLGPDKESLDAGYDSPANIQVRNDARQAAEKKANSGFKTWFSKPDPAKVAQAKAQAVALTFDQQHPTTPDEIAPNEIEGFDFTDFATKHERARNVAQAFREKAAQAKPQPTPDEIPTPQADQAAQPKPQPTPEEVQAALKTFGLDPNKSYSAQDIGTAFLSTADQLNQADPNRSTKFNALFDLRNLLLDNVRKNSGESADQAAQPKPQPTPNKRVMSQTQKDFKEGLEELIPTLSSERLTDVHFLDNTIITKGADLSLVALPLITPHITDPKTINELLKEFQESETGGRLILFIDALTPEQVTDPEVQKTLKEIAGTIQNKQYYTGNITDQALKDMLPEFDKAKFDAHLQSLLTPTADTKAPVPATK